MLTLGSKKSTTNDRRLQIYHVAIGRAGKGIERVDEERGNRRFKWTYR
jgi:hypothetical protein